MKPNQILRQTHRQCYRVTHKLGRLTSRIEVIIDADTRLDSKIVSDIMLCCTPFEFMMQMPLLFEQTKRNFRAPEICGCESARGSVLGCDN